MAYAPLSWRLRPGYRVRMKVSILLGAILGVILVGFMVVLGGAFIVVIVASMRDAIKGDHDARQAWIRGLLFYVGLPGFIVLLFLSGALKWG